MDTTVTKYLYLTSVPVSFMNLAGMASLRVNYHDHGISEKHQTEFIINNDITNL